MPCDVTGHMGEGARLCSALHDIHYRPLTVALQQGPPPLTWSSPSSRKPALTGEFLGRLGVPQGPRVDAPSPLTLPPRWSPPHGALPHATPLHQPIGSPYPPGRG